MALPAAPVAPAAPARPRRLGRGLLVTVVAAGALAVPVSLAGPASAAPCPVNPLPLPIPLPCLAMPAATAAPTVAGTKQVGTVMTATAPVWDQTEVTTTYQWLRDGVAIEGATAKTYTLAGADFDKAVLVRATGTNGLGLSGTSDSASFKPTKGAALTATVAPKITGSSDVGGTLTATPGTWTGTPTPTFTYQWYRSRPGSSGYEAVTGATTPTYSPVVADAGRRIAVLVTAARVGYESGVAASNVGRVPKASTTVALALVRRTVKAGQQASVRVVVTSAAGIVPTGKVTVMEGSRYLRTVTLTTSADGQAVLTLPLLKAGTHRLVARYVGDGAHTTSTSTSQTLTVTR